MQGLGLSCQPIVILRGSCVAAQMLSFDLSAAAPDPSSFDLSAAVTGVQFQARAVRVVSSSASSTTLLVGGVDTSYAAQYPGVIMLVTVAAGADTCNVTGSAVLPSSRSGVTALSQTSTVVPGFVLASTDQGVYKCGRRRLPCPLTLTLTLNMTMTLTLTLTPSCS